MEFGFRAAGRRPRKSSSFAPSGSRSARFFHPRSGYKNMTLATRPLPPPFDWHMTRRVGGRRRAASLRSRTTSPLPATSTGISSPACSSPPIASCRHSMRPCRCTRSRTRRRRCLSRSSRPGRGLGLAGARELGKGCRSYVSVRIAACLRCGQIWSTRSSFLSSSCRETRDRLVVRGWRSRVLGPRRLQRDFLVSAGGGYGASFWSSAAAAPALVPLQPCGRIVHLRWPAASNDASVISRPSVHIMQPSVPAVTWSCRR